MNWTAHSLTPCGAAAVLSSASAAAAQQGKRGSASASAASHLRLLHSRIHRNSDPAPGAHTRWMLDTVGLSQGRCSASAPVQPAAVSHHRLPPTTHPLSALLLFSCQDPSCTGSCWAPTSCSRFAAFTPGPNRLAATALMGQLGMVEAPGMATDLDTDQATAADQATAVDQATVVAQVLMVQGRAMVVARAMGPTGRATAAAARMPWRARSRLAGAQLSPMRRRLPAPRGAGSREACVGGRIVTFLTWLDVRNRLLLSLSCSTTGPLLSVGIAVERHPTLCIGGFRSLANINNQHYHRTSSHRKTAYRKIAPPSCEGYLRASLLSAAFTRRQYTSVFHLQSIQSTTSDRLLHSTQ